MRESLRLAALVRRSLFIFLIFSSALSSAEQNPRLDFALGMLAESRGDAAEAALRFENARIADPLALPLVSRAVARELAAGNRSASVKLYQDLAAARPDELEIQLGYADFLDEQGRGDALAFKLSREALEAALRKHPAHPQLIRRLFHHAQRAGDELRQIALLDQLPADDPESVLLYVSLSRSVFDAGDPTAREKVDQRFLLAMDLHPESRSLARAASEHFRETERADQAIEILKRHVAADPSSLELRTRLGILWLAAKRDAEGESALQAVLAIHPRQVMAHQTLAKFYRLRDQPDPARFHAGELLKIRGGSPTEFITLADEWLAAGAAKQARILLEKAVFDSPDHPELARKLAIATRRDPATRDSAARLFRAAEATEQGLAATETSFLIESAEVMLDAGQSKAAEERLRTAIKSYPPEAKKETAAALRRLALLWETEKRNLDAARALRQRADALDR
jgi:predicted Zn-dependent protease